MAKKKPSREVPTDAASELTHSPFAALSGVTPTASAAPPQPKAASARPTKRGRLVMRRETKHRGGKTAVVVSGFGTQAAAKREEVESIAAALKRTLGCGGTVEDSGPGWEIVLQGDNPAKVAELLRSQGFRVDGVTS
jgi:translation initiation factor 1